MNLLYLVHRMPFPPNKGDKVRSYHLLKHLVAGHQVFLGTFIDDPDDEAHVDTLQAMCAGLHVARLDPRRAKLRSLKALWTGEALTLRYYEDASLARWIEQTTKRHRIDAVVVFSSSMAQYAQALPGIPLLVDFVDVDSVKWAEYADTPGTSQGRAPPAWLLAWLYRREARRLLAFERSVARRARRSFFVTEYETALFRSLAPESAGSIEPMGNGVDADYFSPAPSRASPFADDTTAVVFTGAMDYRPNADAVVWFVREIWPRLRVGWPQLRFFIVGRNPGAAVSALASPDVIVTGTVPDVRPYLQHAAVVVAPLRLARGLQNKILEAMAMARPVVASDSCVAAIDAQPETELLAASTADEFVGQIDALLRAPERAAAIGAAARQRVLKSFSWEAHLSAIDRYLSTRQPSEAVA